MFTTQTLKRAIKKRYFKRVRKWELIKKTRRTVHRSLRQQQSKSCCSQQMRSPMKSSMTTSHAVLPNFVPMDAFQHIKNSGRETNRAVIRRTEKDGAARRLLGRSTKSGQGHVNKHGCRPLSSAEVQWSVRYGIRFAR